MVSCFNWIVRCNGLFMGRLWGCYGGCVKRVWYSYKGLPIYFDIYQIPISMFMCYLMDGLYKQTNGLVGISPLPLIQHTMHG